LARWTGKHCLFERNFRMPTVWLIILTIGALALIVTIYFAKSRNANSRGSFGRAERGAEQLREDIRRDPEYRED
jgi:hypothetical protein